MNNRLEFEKWLAANGYETYGEWHEGEQRYTRFSAIQMWWTFWNAGYQAAKGEAAPSQELS